MTLKKPASDTELDAHEAVNRTTWIKSRYDFLMSHNGIRPRTLHCLMSNTGAGKSTLLKGIIAETALQKKVLIWLSEESVIEYQSLLRTLDKDCLKNITFVEESSIPDEAKKRQSLFFQYFEQMIDESEAEITFIDNVTTSLFYNTSIGFTGQAATARFLPDVAKRKGAIFYVMHTAKEITDNFKRIVTPEDNRGLLDLPMITPYMYIMQKFTANDQICNIINNAKHRFHKKAGGFYGLEFINEAYVASHKIGFDFIAEIFNERDYLGKKYQEERKEQPRLKRTEVDISGPLI